MAKKKAALGVSDLAKELKLEPATVRLKLREKKVKRKGRGYAWNTVAELKKVAQQLSA